MPADQLFAMGRHADTFPASFEAHSDLINTVQEPLYDIVDWVRFTYRGVSA